MNSLVGLGGSDVGIIIESMHNFDLFTETAIGKKVQTNPTCTWPFYLA